MELNVEHRMAAHCENGVISTMLHFHGVELSEPMIFGLASGLFFSHMPFVKLTGMAVTSFRTFPGVFFRRVAKQLGIKIETRRYINKEHAMRDLDALLGRGIPVGCLVGMYYLPYMPKAYRFHFNGHNICISGRDDETGEYTVCDPIATQKVRISRRDLIKVRFAKGGTWPLLGYMYWIKEMPEQLPDLAPIIREAIRKNCNCMIRTPWFAYFAGTRGIFYLSRRIRTWEKSMGRRRAALNLAQIIRMLEEIGTGGAGFRFIYGAFLQEAARITGLDVLNDYAVRITEIGDLWRDFVYKASRVIMRHSTKQYTYDDLTDILLQIARLEDRFFRDLYNEVRPHRDEA